MKFKVLTNGYNTIISYFSIYYFNNRLYFNNPEMNRLCENGISRLKYSDRYLSLFPNIRFSFN